MNRQQGLISLEEKSDPVISMLSSSNICNYCIFSRTQNRGLQKLTAGASGKVEDHRNNPKLQGAALLSILTPASGGTPRQSLLDVHLQTHTHRHLSDNSMSASTPKSERPDPHKKDTSGDVGLVASLHCALVSPCQLTYLPRHAAKEEESLGVKK